jgi:DNA polymerase
VIHSYGPKFLENITQAVSRDILGHGMRLADERGFKIVLSVHDELVAEHSTFDHEDLATMMSSAPGWATGLPLKAAGYTAGRYHK